MRYSWERLYRETGVTTEDIAYRMADYGMHLWSSHHPFIVPQPFTVEPTESYAKEELDEYVAVLAKVSEEAYADPETGEDGSPPQRVPPDRIAQHDFDDPARWAITWRLWKRKHLGMK